MDGAATSITRAQELLTSMNTTGKVNSTFGNEHSAAVSALRSLLCDIKNKPEESLACYQNAVELYQEQLRHDGETSRSIYLKDQLALLLHDSGCICLKLSNHSKALRYFEASLKERRAESSSRMPYRLGCILDAAKTLFSMSKAYEKQGQLGKALRCLGESLKIRDQYDPDSEVLAATHLQIASIAREKRDSAKARVALQAALDIRRKLHNGDEKNESVVTICNALCNLNKEIR
jgi:tetratricopeptide (TPR) repeat protein